MSNRIKTPAERRTQRLRNRQRKTGGTSALAPQLSKNSIRSLAYTTVYSENPKRARFFIGAFLNRSKY
jgi:hypothetical protein